MLQNIFVHFYQEMVYFCIHEEMTFRIRKKVFPVLYSPIPFCYFFQSVWKYEIQLIISNKCIINQGDAKSSNVYISLLAQAITPNDLVMPQ